MKNNILEGNFYNPTRGKIKLNEVVKELMDYILEKPDKFYDIIIGCDSSSDLEPHFPIAIVILRMGEGGRFFLKKVKYPQKKFYNFHQRVLEEVLLSCKLALSLKGKLRKEAEKISSFPDYRFCYIHADIGEVGQTRDMIKEVTGLIRGNGFEPKIKPEAYAASVVADRYS